jgi:hypothetical protein
MAVVVLIDVDLVADDVRGLGVGIRCVWNVEGRIGSVGQCLYRRVIGSVGQVVGGVDGDIAILVDVLIGLDVSTTGQAETGDEAYEKSWATPRPTPVAAALP